MRIGKWLRPFNPFGDTKKSVENDLARKVSDNQCRDLVQLKSRKNQETDATAKQNLSAAIDIIEASALHEQQSDKVARLATGLGIAALAVSSIALAFPPLGIAAVAIIGSGSFLSPMAKDFDNLEEQNGQLRRLAVDQAESLAKAKAEHAGERYESPAYIGEHKHWNQITGDHNRLYHYHPKYDYNSISDGAEHVARMSYLIADQR